MASVDLNADLGESFGIWELGDDDAMLGIVTSANIACGFHAGDPLRLAGSAFFEEAQRLGLRTVAEAFADRAYRPDGQLVSRRENGAVLHDPAQIAERVATMVASGRVTAIDGSVIDVQVESVCVHGDSPGAVEIATAVRKRLITEGIELTAFI